MTRIDLRLEKARGRPLCIGSGFIALDVVQRRAESFSAVGGSCGNVMAILAWLGWNARPSARLGADTNGRVVLEALQDAGVESIHILQDDAVSTPVVIQRFAEDATGQRVHRFSLSCPDCGSWLPRFRATTKKQVVSIMDGPVPRAFYFDRVSPASLTLASWAARRGALVLFEPSSGFTEHSFQQAVDTCHVLKYSNDRLGHIPDLVTVKHPKLIVETCGSEGLNVRWKGRWSHLAAFTAPVFVDAAGSGDWCSAGLIHQLSRIGTVDWSRLRKVSIDRALRFGQAMAAINCGFESARGAMASLPFNSFSRALRSLVEDRTRSLYRSHHEADFPQIPAGLCRACVDGKMSERRDRRRLVRVS